MRQSERGRVELLCCSKAFLKGLQHSVATGLSLSPQQRLFEFDLKAKSPLLPVGEGAWEPEPQSDEQMTKQRQKHEKYKKKRKAVNVRREEICQQKD